MTEILMMTLTLQLRKIRIKKKALHPSSIREPENFFQKLLDKLEEVEITMKLEETENLKLQYVNNIHTNTSQINNILESDTERVEKNHSNSNNGFHRNRSLNTQLKIILSFSEFANAAESIQVTMNPYLMGGPSISSNKPIMVFTGTGP